MGTKVITGSFNKANGKVTFADEACDGTTDYEGCFVTSGVHAGQIKVSINDEQCDDTYYGCFDRTNSPPNFEVAIPDDCCIEPGDDCEHCDPEGETPLYHTVTFSSLQICPCFEDPPSISVLYEDCDSLNGQANLLTQGIAPWNDDCTWGVFNYDDYGTRKHWMSSSTCSGEPSGTTDLTYVLIALQRTALDLGLGASFNTTMRAFGDSISGTSADCCEGETWSNDYDSDDCSGYGDWLQAMYGGTATVQEGDRT